MRYLELSEYGLNLQAGFQLEVEKHLNSSNYLVYSTSSFDISAHAIRPQQDLYYAERMLTKQR
jgi:hypothetical protein